MNITQLFFYLPLKPSLKNNLPQVTNYNSQSLGHDVIRSVNQSEFNKWMNVEHPSQKSQTTKRTKREDWTQLKL